MTSYPKVAAGTLRLVKASAEEFAAIDQQRRNAALKVNMFTPFNVSSLNKAQKRWLSSTSWPLHLQSARPTPISPIHS